MVVHHMNGDDGDLGDLGDLTFREPVPDHTASADGGEPAAAAEDRPKKRLLPGSRDTGSRDQRRINGRPQREPREKKPLPPIPRNGFVPDIERLYVAIGLGIMPFDVELASKVTEIAHPAAEAWDELARKNEVVRRALVAILETGAWGKVLAAHAPLVSLAFARATGESVRVTFAASQLGREAENHANRGHGENPAGSP